MFSPPTLRAMRRLLGHSQQDLAKHLKKSHSVWTTQPDIRAFSRRVNTL